MHGPGGLIEGLGKDVKGRAFDARVVGGDLIADGVEVSHCAWFADDELQAADISTVSRSVLIAVGALAPQSVLPSD